MALTTTVPPLLPAVLADATFEAVVFDWDGIVVPGGSPDDAAAMRARVEALCAAGVHVVVVSDSTSAMSTGNWPPGRQARAGCTCASIGAPRCSG